MYIVLVPELPFIWNSSQPFIPPSTVFIPLVHFWRPTLSLLNVHWASSYTEHSFPAVPIPHCICSCWNPCSGHMQSQLYMVKWNKQWWQRKPAAATGNRSHNNILWSHLPSLKAPRHWLLIFIPCSARILLLFSLTVSNLSTFHL